MAATVTSAANVPSTTHSLATVSAPGTIKSSDKTVLPPQPPPPDLQGLDRALYLFGNPIAHSLSPLFHNSVYANLSLNYRQFLYETSFLDACLSLTQDPKFLGASVTMPLKIAIIPHLHTLTPAAAAIGAVNTISWLFDNQGKRIGLQGANTDCIGIREAIKRNVNPDPALAILEKMRGQPALVIGGGGTCRAAVYALRVFLGCGAIYLVNRDQSELDAVVQECTARDFGENLICITTPEQAQSADLPPPVVAVSAVPDFAPRTDGEVRARRIIEMLLQRGSGKHGDDQEQTSRGVLLEMCYHPSPNTEIDALARCCGWQVIPGSEAMIWQGFEQDRIWLEREVSELPLDIVRGVIAAKLAEDKQHA